MPVQGRRCHIDRNLDFARILERLIGHVPAHPFAPRKRVACPHRREPPRCDCRSIRPRPRQPAPPALRLPLPPPPPAAPSKAPVPAPPRVPPVSFGPAAGPGPGLTSGPEAQAASVKPTTAMAANLGVGISILETA